MVLAEKSTRDFFISYNRQDREMAEWIAWQLEEAGYTTVIQSWDFSAGGNFVMEMDQAAKMAERTLAVLSPTYLASSFTRPEWMAAFAEDPTSTQRKLVPVRVAECELTGLLAQIVYIDLVGKNEAEARETLLAKIKVTERAKPSAPPVFGMSKNAAAAVVRAVEPAPAAKPAVKPASCLLWNVPQARNPFFTGREKEMTELHRTLTADSKTASTHALTGLGGMGKTQTAIEYAYRYRDEYAAVFWARAGSDQELLTDYNHIAKLLELPEADAQNPDEMREAVRKWLATNERWLLILDNVNTPTAVKPFLPTIHSGCVLITTRTQEVRSLGITAPLSLSQLAPDEAQSFLLRSAGREAGDKAEDTAARKLGVGSEDCPLALEQAAAYIAQNDTRFQSYLKSFQRRRLALLDAQAPCTGDYQQSIATTWDINFQAIQQKSRAAIDLLRLSAFLSPERIPLELLITSASELGDTLKDALDGADEDELVLDDLLLPLTRYSLVHRNRETNSHDIHRLVQEVTRMNMDEEMRRTWAEKAVKAVSNAFPEAQFENWTSCDRLMPHALACAEHITAEDFESESAVHLLRHLGNYLNDRAQYIQAEAILSQALALREKMLGNDHLEVAELCNDLGNVFRPQGRWKEAESMFFRAHKIWEAKLGSEHAQTAKGLNNLAVLYAVQERHKDAESYFRSALEVREKALGPDHEQTATTINNLAQVLEDQGMSREAEPLFLRAYNIWNKALGPEHPKLVLVLTNLAEMYTKQARYAEAGTLFRKALTIAEKAYGPEHPEVAYTLGSLALLYKDQGQFEEAAPLLERAYHIMAQTLGPDHKETLLYRERYTTLLRDLGRDVDADALEQSRRPLCRAIALNPGPFSQKAWEKGSERVNVVHWKVKNIHKEPRLDSSPEVIVRQEIDFGGGRRAQMVMPPAGANPADIAQALGLEQPDALMLIFGGADGMEAEAQTRIARLFRESLVPLASARRALIIDGGTQSGIMQILGEVIADRQDSPCVLGVAPIAKVTYPGKTGTTDADGTAALDPNHSHFILTPTSEWGSETETIFDMTALLSEPYEARSGVVALLANGGGIAKEEAYRCVWQGWNLVVLAGTGRVADEIADAYSRLPALPADPKIRDIIRRSAVTVFPVEAEPAALTTLLESLEKQKSRSTRS